MKCETEDPDNFKGINIFSILSMKTCVFTNEKIK